MFKLICMSFDGEFVSERPAFETVEEVWEYSGDLGSKWFFYPFHFAVSESGKTIKGASFPLDRLVGKRVKTVAKLFNLVAMIPECRGMGAGEYCWFVADHIDAMIYRSWLRENSYPAAEDTAARCGVDPDLIENRGGDGYFIPVVKVIKKGDLP